MGLTSPFVFYALVDIAIRFFYTDLSVLILLSLDQTLTEGSHYHDYSVRYNEQYFENF